MKKVLAILVIALFAMFIACAKSSQSAGVPTSPDATASGPTGSDTAPGTVTNDETTTGTYQGGQDNQAHIPTITTSYSYLAKNWMHANLPTWGSHFKSWMISNGYSDVANMTGPATSTGSGAQSPGFGGFQSGAAPSSSTITHSVVVLVHGNGSKAQGAPADQRGWFDTYKMLRDSGWNNSEIYAVNFLDSEAVLNAANNDNRSTYTNRVKRFIDAVYAYVNAYKSGTKLTVLAHSLGCTVARKAMYDGNQYSKVQTFISMNGGNAGLLTCGMYTGAGLVWTYVSYGGYGILPTCSASTGLALAVPYYIAYGICYGASDITSFSLNTSLVATNSYSLFNPLGFWNTSGLVNTSYFVGALNNADKQFKSGTSTATRAYCIGSEVDEIVGIRASGTYGQRWWSFKLAGAYGTATYTVIPYGHFGCKSRTTAVQKNMILRTYSGNKTNPTS